MYEIYGDDLKGYSSWIFLFKLDVDGQIDSVHLFLSPRQVHLLLDMLAAVAGPGKYNSTINFFETLSNITFI